jgi:hypothetical protein
MTLPAPKHHWSFDEGSGTIARDSAGGATIQLDRASWAPGRFGSAIRLNPQDGARSVMTRLAERPPPWTIAIWVKREADSKSASLISSPSRALRLEQWMDTHQVGFTRFAPPGKPGFDIALRYTAPLNQWAHLVLVGTDTRATLYAGGASQGSIDESFDLGMQWIGSTWGWHKVCSALVDEIKVFDQALTDAQVAELATTLESGSFYRESSEIESAP